jgi:hypothetical protein
VRSKTAKKKQRKSKEKYWSMLGRLECWPSSELAPVNFFLRSFTTPGWKPGIRTMGGGSGSRWSVMTQDDTMIDIACLSTSFVWRDRRKACHRPLLLLLLLPMLLHQGGTRLMIGLFSHPSSFFSLLDSEASDRRSHSSIVLAAQQTNNARQQIGPVSWLQNVPGMRQ